MLAERQRLFHQLVMGHRRSGHRHRIYLVDPSHLRERRRLGMAAIAPCRRNLGGVARLTIDNADDLELVASVHDRKMAVPGDPPDADRGDSNRRRHASAPVEVHGGSPTAARSLVWFSEN